MATQDDPINGDPEVLRASGQTLQYTEDCNLMPNSFTPDGAARYTGVGVERSTPRSLLWHY
jgi:hypothetical protein